MSTFDGFVEEFPRIRIDDFRPLSNLLPPLACFLSHVHSDHLRGLESLKSPFVYCSPATREILLKLEKWPHRMNFAKGILECRRQTYKHLRSLLKTIPLETPTKIELAPGNEIQVTLFDANHCIGAVMFLIEGHGKAVLYTGDARLELWLVNSLVRSPALVPYTFGARRLDRLYLDTTFAEASDQYQNFPAQASGLAELLEKVSRYPEETIFYCHAWTFGYEDVWVALSRSLNSPVHLDRYRYGLYSSVANTTPDGPQAREAAVLCGYQCGNVRHPGVITRFASPERVRIHSCERGSGCWVFDAKHPLHSRVVDITPIVSRHNGRELRELGAGGGKGDLDQAPELELMDEPTLARLMGLCETQIADSATVARVREFLQSNLSSRDRATPATTADLRLPLDLDEHVTLNEAVDIIAALAVRSTNPRDGAAATPLSKAITFPYARHSSLRELRHAVEALRPRDVWPCTAPSAAAWDGAWSVRRLFGDVCSGECSAFDEHMRAEAALLDPVFQRSAREQERRGEQYDTDSDDVDGDGDAAGDEENAAGQDENKNEKGAPEDVSAVEQLRPSSAQNPRKRTKSHPDMYDLDDDDDDGGGDADKDRDERNEAAGPQTDLDTLSAAQQRLQARRTAFDAARRGRWARATRVASAAAARRIEFEEEL